MLASIRQDCSYTIAVIAGRVGQRVVAIDEYATSHRFTLDAVYEDDKPGIKPGARVLVHEDGLVELASASFTRHHDALREERTCNTAVFELGCDDEE